MCVGVYGRYAFPQTPTDSIQIRYDYGFWSNLGHWPYIFSITLPIFEKIDKSISLMGFSIQIHSSLRPTGDANFHFAPVPFTSATPSC